MTKTVNEEIKSDEKRIRSALSVIICLIKQTDEVSSASTDTSHLQAVQIRHSAAPWHLERQVYVALQLREA
jgi:hypothetical protein